MTRQSDHIRRSARGRPALSPLELTESRRLTLLPSTWEFLCVIGQGNASRGVRVAERIVRGMGTGADFVAE